MTLAVDTQLATVLGDRIAVATYHHQAIRTLGVGLAVCGWAEDGVVEAIEVSGRPWAFGVQWHPEAYDGDVLFSDLVAACLGRRPIRAAP